MLHRLAAAATANRRAPAALRATVAARHTNAVPRVFSTSAAAEPAEPPTITLTGDLGEDGDAEEDDTNVPMDMMKPRLVVQTLDRFIVGQQDAKRAVAVALRNRWRRQQLHESVRGEVTPKNILMVGPTGCGKTEIARRLATLAGSPFVKVEATKFTEVGFHGRDVDMIIRDLLDNSIALVKKLKTEQLRAQVERQVNQLILQKLVGGGGQDSMASFEKLLEEGNLEGQSITVEVPVKPPSAPSVAGGPDGRGGAIDLGEFMKGLRGDGQSKTQTKRMTVGEARPILQNIEMERLIEQMDITAEAIKLAEESGIVFIDEIDKICSTGDYRGADASAEGVQRDMLPLIEGSVVSTKQGNVNTDHILFVCSGAFHNCKPADLLPELQGRLPIRVELQGLKEEDLFKILTEPEVSLIKQQQMLLGTEGVDLQFEDDAVKEIAKMAYEMNSQVENIGARRLHTVMERISDEFSFEAADMDDGTEIKVDVDLVQERLGKMLEKQDLSRFIL